MSTPDSLALAVAVDAAEPGVPAVLAPTRTTLRATLRELAEQHGTGDSLRPAVLAALRQALGNGRAAIRQQFETNGSGEECVRRNSDLMDMVIRSLAELVRLADRAAIAPRG